MQMRSTGLADIQSKAAAELADFSAHCCPSERDLPREICELLRCIHSDPFDSRLSVKTLKSRCRIRDNNVSSRFNRAMGITIKAYIEQQRMEAARLLLHRSIGIAEVAQLVGYDHLQTFYRIFHRRFGCTPAIFRVRSASGREVAL